MLNPQSKLFSTTDSGKLAHQLRTNASQKMSRTTRTDLFRRHETKPTPNIPQTERLNLTKTDESKPIHIRTNDHCRRTLHESYIQNHHGKTQWKISSNGPDLSITKDWQTTCHLALKIWLSKHQQQQSFSGLPAHYTNYNFFLEWFYNDIQTEHDYFDISVGGGTVGKGKVPFDYHYYCFTLKWPAACSTNHGELTRQLVVLRDTFRTCHRYDFCSVFDLLSHFCSGFIFVFFTVYIVSRKRTCKMEMGLGVAIILTFFFPMFDPKHHL